MSQHWFNAEFSTLRQECEVLETLNFHTKNELFADMLEPLLEAATLPFAWVLMDEAFGNDSKLLNRLYPKQENDSVKSQKTQ